MSKTALYYSPVGGNVNRVANMLGALIGNDKVDIIPVKEVEKGDLTKYEKVILLGSTVGTDHWSNELLQTNGQSFSRRLRKLVLRKKRLLLSGLETVFYILITSWTEWQFYMKDSQSKMRKC